MATVVIITWASCTPKGQYPFPPDATSLNSRGGIPCTLGDPLGLQEERPSGGSQFPRLSASSSLPAVLVGPQPLPRAWCLLSHLFSVMTGPDTQGDILLVGHEWTPISLCSCLSHRELRSWHVQREEYAAPDHGREYQLRGHVATVRQERCGKQQTGIWAGAGTSVQKRGQCVLCLAARSAPCSDLEGWTVHQRAEMVGLVPDRSQTESGIQTQPE